MCGVVGYIVDKNQSQYNHDLKIALSKLGHRGPDHQGIWEEEGVGLGHARLSILDLSAAGNQPMISYDGRYVLSFNGQVYNFLEIAQKLKKKIKPSSDTRVILEAIEEFGLKCAVSLFNGMFAFVLWDRQENKLFLVRDSIGIKPLYWAKTSSGHIFGSELKVLTSFSEFRDAISSQGLESYFDHQAVYGPLTIYKDCFKLLPGQILEVTSHDAKSTLFSPETKSYAHIKTMEEADACFEGLLRDSVLKHARSDVDFSAFLSGGIDSSLVTSLLSEKYSVKTYSIGYEEKDFDESKKAQKIAKVLGLEHEIVLLSPSIVFPVIEKISEMYDEPFADASCLPTYLLSKEVAKHTKVAFSGDGADELFAGYPRYFNAVEKWEKINFLPHFMRCKILKNIIPPPSPFINFFAKAFLKNPQLSLPYVKKLFQYKTVWDLFCGENSLRLPASVLKREAKRGKDFIVRNEDQGPVSSLKSLLIHDQAFRLPDEMLTKVDRASMANSLEVRVPFLDNEIIAFARSLPDSFLGRKSAPKVLLRRLLSKYLPKELIEGPKVGFHVPLKIWLRTEYKAWAEEMLFGQEESPFYQSALKDLWKEYCSGDAELFYPLWSAIIYHQWARRFYS